MLQVVDDSRKITKATYKTKQRQWPGFLATQKCLAAAPDSEKVCADVGLVQSFFESVLHTN